MTAHTTREIASTDGCRNLGAGRGQRKSKTQVRVPFTEAEDSKLRQLVSIYGENCWRIVSLHMAERTAKQCKDRYFNSLAPNLKNGEWTKEEEDILCAKVAQFGTHWNLIATHFKNRSPNNIKNHWNRVISKKQKKDASVEAKQEKLFFENFDEFELENDSLSYDLCNNWVLADML